MSSSALQSVLARLLRPFRKARSGEGVVVEAELAKRLALIQIEPDGTIRALASHWLAGKPSSDPRTSAWLTEALVARQRKTARYWFERTNPLDEIVFDGGRLCWKDLAIAHAFTPARGTTYTVLGFDRAGQQRGSVDVTARDSGVTCANTSLAGGDGYTIFKIDTKRTAFAGSTHAHVARDPTTHIPRVIGIWRP